MSDQAVDVQKPIFDLSARMSSQKALSDHLLAAKKRREVMSKWRGIPAKTAKSQKIRGMSAIAGLTRYGLRGHAVRDWVWSPAAWVAEGIAGPHGMCYPVFARPCPITPRHGFVDSRLVKDDADLQSLAVESCAADPQAEILLTRFIDSKISAVITPQTLAIGKGHEGATSGKSVTLFGPAPSAHQVNSTKVHAGIAEGDVPYVEAVGDYDELESVQVRGGPADSVAVDFVPNAIVVCSVIVATEDYDLLKWERDIAAAPDGTVVHAPNMSLSSHFCVHAVVHGIPVLTTREPVIGETLAETGAPVWTPGDWRRLAKAVRNADALIADHGLGQRMACLAVGGLHCAGTPAPATDAQLNLLALGAVSALKHIGAACLGEARHANSQTFNRNDDAEARIAMMDRRSHGNSELTRTAIFDRAERASINLLRGALMALVPIYRKASWDTSYGGKKWAAINSSARRLAIGLDNFQKSPSPEKWAKVVTAWNEAIHREHNGQASALSKFDIGKSHMNYAVAWPVAFIAGRCGDALKLVIDGPISDRNGLITKKRAVKAAHSKTYRSVVARYDSDYFVLIEDSGFTRVKCESKALDEELYHRPNMRAECIVKSYRRRLNGETSNSVRALASVLGVDHESDAGLVPSSLIIDGKSFWLAK